MRSLYYDNDGRISRIEGQYGYFTYTPNYDTSGKISSMTVQVDGQVRLIQYTYDGADRLIRLEISGDSLPSSNYLIEYAYDADGNLARKVQTYYARDPYDHTHTKLYISRLETMEYNYNAKGTLVAASFIEQRFVDGVTYESRDEYTFSHDEFGRLVRYDIAYDDANHTTGYVEFTYGNFIYYAD